MFDMLDVAIGIAFVFLLTSLIASAVQEMIEARLKRRASDLRDGIGELLRDPPVMQAIYDHSLVNGLYKGANYTAANNAGDLPSYIPARNFALALMDVAFSTAGASGAQRATPMPPVVAGAVVVPAPPPVVPVNLAGLPAAPAGVAVTNADLARTLRVFAEAAALDPAKTRENIENWYNTAMDRVSGWYKRRSQRWLLVIGFVLAVAMNVDAIRVTRELVLNKTVRNAVVAKAIAFDKKHQASAT